MRHQDLSRKTIRPHLGPSVATVIAFVALIVALEGPALGSSSVGGRNSAHAAKGTPGPRGPRGPRGFRGPAGPAGTAGAPGSALAYAHFQNGVVDPATSKNIDPQTVDLATAGVTCFVVTGGTPKNVTAMIDSSGADPRTSQIGGNVAPPGGTANGCPSGDNVEISTSSAGRFVNLSFYVTIN